MSAWAHRIEPLSERDRWRAGNDPALPCCSRCKGPLHERPRAVAYACYNYVTGRAGRVSYAQVGVCFEHMQRFMRKYKIQMEE